MMNKNFENKQKVKTFLIKFKIRKVTVSAYHSQTNDIIKYEHTLIMQTLLKSCKNQLY